MIICHCNVINDKEIKQAARELCENPEGGVPTPGAVFRHLGYRPKCGGCFKSIIEVVYAEAEQVKDDSGQ
ncbi:MULTISPECIES: (2Fe-2S)-binding protein [unclassified Pseudovibrio]|uniref:(2Fe-2S)-binding protein n=1 Tax=unclassified Pseudovibrio TaxID=2627060 RepID=UPI00070DA141|nr:MULTISPECIES: (2Fe-2S)-binding protein [unclassified Pseudovibrio]